MISNTAENFGRKVLVSEYNSEKEKDVLFNEV
jgi:hypothetical protein